jgi:hypothetical protein
VPGSRPEPEPNPGDDDGAEEDVGPLVEARCHGSVGLELVDHPLDFVPARVPVRDEAGRSASLASAMLAMSPLVSPFGDGVLDLPTT